MREQTTPRPDTTPREPEDPEAFRDEEVRPLTPFAQAAAACANHPRREAIGICVRCRKQVCGECTTKVDGINHCVSCLAALAGPRKEKADGTAESSAAVASLWLALGLGTMTLLAWAVLEIGALW